jgi:predicted aldo/keto reductase-like oxidoreductase
MNPVKPAMKPSGRPKGEKSDGQDVCSCETKCPSNYQRKKVVKYIRGVLSGSSCD